LVRILKNYVILSFFVKIIESNQEFFIKTEIVNDLLCGCNWHNRSINFDEKFLFRFKKFNEKDKIALIFIKSRSNWN